MRETNLHDALRRSLNDDEMKDFLNEHSISLEEAETMSNKFADMLLALEDGLITSSDLKDWVKHMDLEWKGR